ncbi:MAG TPA: hypothetical protein VK783_09130 [Bacteroidia bacterium]|nr:hypothetical protein [Bacteroidia bacterium]
MKEQYVENDFFEIWREDGIIFTVFKKNVVLNLEISKQVVAERMKVSNGKPTPIFIDLINVVTTDTKARKYMASKEAVEFIKAGAFLLDNEIMKLAGNIFIKIDKPLITTKLFTDRDKAIAWLQDFK